MGHAEIENQTPFVFEVLHLLDEECRPLAVPLLKATFVIDRRGRCIPAERQLPLNLSGEHWGDDAETSSYRYEPEVAFTKLTTDVVLNGQAHAPTRGTREMRVELRVGRLAKELLVFGERVWFRTLGTAAISAPIPFETVPLRYERAFGGWDKTHGDSRQPSCEPRNPVGMGFREGGAFEEGLRLPNLEDPRDRIRRPSDRPQPAGFGFVSPHWQPRVSLAGTYDQRWRKERAPVLPADFQRSHLNAASDGMVTPQYLRGGEPVVARGVTSEQELSFSLPRLREPSVELVLCSGQRHRFDLDLDTVIIEPDDRRVTLLYRRAFALKTGPQDLARVSAKADHELS